MSDRSNQPTESGQRRPWLNRTVIGIGLASFFSDLSHETATAVLPLFLASMGSSAAALGMIEGISDALSSFAKWPGGWFADRTGIRKPIGVLGYSLTTLATGSFAWARSWTHVLAGRVIAWSGRGIRTPVRDTLMSEAVEPAHYGRAFGVERTLDTLGAIAGPLLALWFLRWFPVRQIFLWTLIPGLLAVATFGLLVQAKRAAPNHGLTFHGSWKGLPLPFKRYLVGVGLFGLGDFAHTLLILRAVQMLTPGRGVVAAGMIGVGLYALHNAAYATACFVSGQLGDRWGKRRILALGYLLSAGMCVGFLLPLAALWHLAALFLVGGAFVGVEETLEKAVARTYYQPSCVEADLASWPPSTA
ncbi:MAG: MFS transporter [Candidatus Omnitrophica bacterium CG11_big_fil_rev_8_21_14_0_20_64_10]|nr:MAG: MFS transporter [Candidatus Omnitrophica bacterium CG11_big_fil_rev_8_21_14_0_20_64_10]